MLNDSLWIDEASLALNILSRNFLELTLHLDYAQASPILLLWFIKIASLSLDGSELSLRIVPFMAGVSALIVFYYCARQILSNAGTVVSLVLLALSPQLIYRSAEVHQYSTDVFASVLITYLGFRLISKPTLKILIATIFIPPALIWLSHPSVFALSAVGIVALATAVLHKDKVQFGYLTLSIFFWLASFGILYFQSLEEIGNRQYFIEGWGQHRDAFMPWGWQTALWLAAKSKELLELPLLGPFLVMLPLTIAGSLILGLRDWRQATILLMPIIVTMIVSSAKLYPFADRLIIFLIPQITLLLATAIEALITAKWRYIGSLMSFLVLAALLLHPFRWNTALIVFPQNFGRENFRDVFKLVENSAQCKDQIFIHKTAENHYKYYHTYRGMDPKSIARILTNAELTNIISQTPKCIWIVYAHVSKLDQDATTASLTAVNYGVLHQINRIGAAAALYSR